MAADRGQTRLNGCAFSPDGKLLAVSTDTGVTNVLDVTSGHDLMTCIAAPGEPEAVLACAFSPDGELMASTTAGASVALWDVPGGARWTQRERYPIHACAFSPDGRLLVTVGNGGTVTIRSVVSGEPLAAFAGYRQPAPSSRRRLLDCDFSPDGSLLATGGADGVHLWDPMTGSIAGRFDHPEEVGAVAFSPDGALLVSGACDGLLRLFDPHEQWTVRRVVGAHDGPILACAFAPDGRHVATTGEDGSVRLWDRDFEGERRGCVGVEEWRLADVETEPGQANQPSGHHSAVTSCSFSPDGRRLATGDRAGNAALWDGATGVQVVDLRDEGMLEEYFQDRADPRTGLARDVRLSRSERPGEGGNAHDEAVRACVFTRDGTALVTVGDEGRAKIWESRSGRLVHVVETTVPPYEWDEALDLNPGSAWVSPDGSLVAIAGTEYPTMTVTEVQSGTTAAVLGYEGSAFEDGSDWPEELLGWGFSADEIRLVSVDDRGIRWWVPASGASSVLRSGHVQNAGCAFSPDGRYLLTTGSERDVRTWDLVAGELRGRWEPSGTVDRAVFSPDGEVVATLSAGSGRVEIRHACDGATRAAIPSHGGGVVTATFDPNGRWFATAGRDRAVRVWETALGTLRMTLPLVAQVNAIAFHPNLPLLACADSTGGLDLYALVEAGD